MFLVNDLDDRFTVNMPFLVRHVYFRMVCTALLTYFPPSSEMKIAAAADNLSTALSILKDIGESLTNIPYVKSVAGISVQILEIRDVCF